MMLKVLKSKTALLATSLAMVAAATGLTLAWWTDDKSATSDAVNLGSLRVDVAVEEDADTYYYEPGMELERGLSIANKGTIAAITKYTGNVIIKLYGSDSYVMDQSGAVTGSLSHDGAPCYGMDDEGNVLWAWFREVDAPENLYLFTMPGGAIDAVASIVFDGDLMDNSYQRARVKLSGDLETTQAMDGAMVSKWGIDFDALEMLEEDDYPVGMGLFSANSEAQYVYNYVRAVFGR